MLESPPKAYAVLLAERAAAGTPLPTPRPGPRLHLGRRTTGLSGPPLSPLMAGGSMPESTAPRRWPATSAAHSATTRRPLAPAYRRNRHRGRPALRVESRIQLGRHCFSLGLGVVGHHVNNVDQRMPIVP